MRDDECDVWAASALVVAKLGKPTLAPGLCALQFPKDNAGRRSTGCVDALHEVGAKFALSDWLDGIQRKAGTEDFLEIRLESLPLRLLRGLLGFALELFDGTGHRFNRLVLLDDLQPDCLTGLLARFAADIIDGCIHALLDREFELALLFLKNPLLSEDFSLHLLSFSQLYVIDGKG